MGLEGVVKFRQKFVKKDPLDFYSLIELNSWRKLFYRINLIGKSEKYGGAGYGNLSMRLDHENADNKKKFVITGTQTGEIEELNENHYATVLEYYPEKNFLVCEGPIMASSESMTHGTIYDLDHLAGAVFHVHSQDIWKNYKKVEIPATKESVEYGTPEMAEEVRRLFRETNVKNIGIFTMLGHEDGLVSFGKNCEEAGNIIISYLVRSWRA